MSDRNWNLSTWTPWSQPSLPLYLVMTLNPSFGPLREHIGVPLFTSVVLFEQRSATWIYRPSEASELGQRMVDYLSVPAHRRAFEDGLEDAEALLIRTLGEIGESDVERLGLAEALQRYTLLVDAFTAFYRLGAFVEPIQIFFQGAVGRYTESADGKEKLDDLIERHGDDVLAAMYTPPVESYAMDRLRDEVSFYDSLVPLIDRDASIQRDLRAVIDNGTDAELLAIIDRADPSAATALAQILQQYAWSTNNYERCRLLTAKEILERIVRSDSPESSAEDAQRNIRQIEESRSRLLAIKADVAAVIPATLAEYLSIHDLVGGSLLDLRKKLVMMANGAFSRLLDRLAVLTETDADLLRYLLPQEVTRFAADPSRYAERLAQRVESTLVYQADFSVLDFSSQEDYRSEPFEPMDGPFLVEGRSEVDQAFEQLSSRLNILVTEPRNADVINGFVAFTTAQLQTIEGRARVVRDPHGQSIKPDEILVASSTTPDFLPLMVDCAAIVTDWGGATSHAAITARELQKPCIIGTNYASLVLRDGDHISIDLVSGVVRRIDAP